MYASHVPPDNENFPLHLANDDDHPSLKIYGKPERMNDKGFIQQRHATHHTKAKAKAPN
jgi:hypothetical protein